MKTDLPQTIYAKDYKSFGFSLEKTSLTFELGEEKARVTAQTRFRKTAGGQAELVLDGSDFLSLIEVKVDGKIVAAENYVLSADKLCLKNVPDNFLLEIITDIEPQNNSQLSGLYKSSGNFCTQCEAEGFRRITFFPDRPDVLTVYDVKIIANQALYPVLLSNGNLVEKGTLPEDKHFALWQDPFPKPSYLFALVAGDLACLSDTYKTTTGKLVDLHIYATPKDIDKCDFAMQSLKRSMKWDEDVYGLEYDLEIYNIVAVSDFNMGAMENKSLNVFNTKYVLASKETATDTDFAHVEGVIGHEYFHNWTGNRVTCRDWFQLSLKEGLTVFRDQEFSADMGSRAVKRIDDVRVLRAHQFPEDAGPMAHPIRPESYIEINNFYTATVYNKGAEVIRMMHTLLGAKNFRKGMDLYFDRHDGAAVTCEDFVAAMEDASGIDLKQFRRWYEYAGTPEVTVESHYDDGQGAWVLTVAQSCPDTPGQSDKKAMQIPVLAGFVGETGMAIFDEGQIDGDVRLESQQQVLLNVTEKEQSFSFRNVSKGHVPSLLCNFSAPVKLNHSYSRDQLVTLASFDQDPFNRWEAVQRLATDVILSKVAETSSFDRASHLDPHLDPHLDQVFAASLADHQTDPALLAEALNLPGETYLGQMMDVVDVDGLHNARKAIIQGLVDKHYDGLLTRYHQMHDGAVYQYNEEDAAKRRLKNTLLSYLMEKNNAEVQGLVQKQFEMVDNMTDQIAAFGVAQKDDGALRENITKAFYQQWKDDDLVLDKWFAVQAQTPKVETVDVVKALAEHPDYSISNPNRMRSLLAPFAMLNQVGFHALSGEGYKFTADLVMQVDAINPQTAARMVSPFNQFARFDQKRQAMMKAEMQRIMDRAGCSKDVYEIVSKGLNKG